MNGVKQVKALVKETPKNIYIALDCEHDYALVIRKGFDHHLDVVKSVLKDGQARKLFCELYDKLPK